MAQIRTFGQTLPLTGIVLTKMDGTARGGIVVALKEEFDLPVKFLGVGREDGRPAPVRDRRLRGGSAGGVRSA